MIQKIILTITLFAFLIGSFVACSSKNTSQTQDETNDTIADYYNRRAHLFFQVALWGYGPSSGASFVEYYLGFLPEEETAIDSAFYYINKSLAHDKNNFTANIMKLRALYLNSELDSAMEMLDKNTVLNKSFTSGFPQITPILKNLFSARKYDIEGNYEKRDSFLKRNADILKIALDKNVNILRHYNPDCSNISSQENQALALLSQYLFYLRALGPAYQRTKADELRTAYPNMKEELSILEQEFESDSLWRKSFGF